MANEFIYVFVDVVQYSARENKDQRALVLELTQALKDSFVGHLLENPDKGYFLPTGDGFAVALSAPEFHDHPQQVVDFAVSLSHTMASRAKLRTGVHRGPGYPYADFNARFLQTGTRMENHNNLAGSALNFAQRVMSLADPGDILATDTFFKHCADTSAETAKLFVEAGDVQVKHGFMLKTFKYAPTQGDRDRQPRRIADYINAKREIAHSLSVIHYRVANTVFGKGAKAALKARVSLLLFDPAANELFVSNFRFGDGIKNYDRPCEIRFSLKEGPGLALAHARDGKKISWYYELPPPPPEGSASNYYAEVERAMRIKRPKSQMFHRPSRAYLYMPVHVGDDSRDAFGVISIDALQPLFTGSKRREIAAREAGPSEWLQRRLTRFNARVAEPRRHIANAWVTISHY